MYITVLLQLLTATNNSTTTPTSANNPNAMITAATAAITTIHGRITCWRALGQK